MMITTALPLTKKVIDLPVDLKKKLAVRAAAVDLSLNKYIRRILEETIVEEEKEEAWLAPYFNEPEDYLSREEAQRELKRLGWK